LYSYKTFLQFGSIENMACFIGLKNSPDSKVFSVFSGQFADFEKNN